ncbi:putative E3 ubiquitin-protein ligase XBAT35 isoform X1 [Rhododendron vialii]|uniref:putative E3 ubiquitin-protein ligase XBAT35 isoform X1 n=1 Tax=Rhododendron vialii TaxID=182163 RepID=UPI00265E5A61|nr:putative E3 ubiquitin-protein ligase XBAT35 isoform X1 [Rhododendron vialii]XP_058209393.1 putative E3 ubiquitin-protein ligase XBAT35 isoform X1 [Rhododendron vialii]XP_058209394.1 putative E3 ubiquitin-protein ligase XBAT35 isoform X1 [Rhododendron vialii]
MGQQQSREELLYQQVSYGNVEGIKALRAQGAGLEWIDREGKTPLILASMNSELYNVAKALIELGANVNAYRPGRNAGTPLHHAAKRGLEQTVKLLLSHGANTLLMNDDCQTPLDVARAKGCTNVVRAIESHICLFSGWLRELYGPGFLEVLAPQLLSRRVWVAVLPCGSRNLAKPFKLELAIYSTLQDSQPRTLIALWKANMEEPKFNQPDPTVIISDIPNISRRWRRRRGILTSREARCKSRGVRQTRIKFAPANETDKQQLQRFCNACKGIPQVTHSNFPFNAQAPVVPPTTPSSAEDVELAMALNASIQSAMESRPPYVDANPKSGASTSSSSQSGSGWATSPAPPRKGTTSGSEIQDVGPSSNPIQLIQNQNETPSSSLPSAPPIEDAVIDDGPVQYPSVDFSPIELSSPVVENLIPAKADEGKEDGGGASSSCVICLDAPVEGACIPCGHMAGCMSCLNEIKGKKWGCPVCRTKIDQIVRLYAV